MTDELETPTLSFGEEIELEESGFSFKPIQGFELEVDGSVYMYSEDGNLEISLVGGELSDDVSIAELNDELAGEFMETFDEVTLTEAGIDTIQDISGFIDQITFTHAEENGLGCAFICSPYVNQYFFMLVISSEEHWQKQGQEIYQTIKSHIRFHPQFKPEPQDDIFDEHPDLTIETVQNIQADEDFLLKIDKNDLSLLMAVRSFSPDEIITLTEITHPDGQSLYHYDPQSGAFQSSLFDQPVIGDHGEMTLYLPKRNEKVLQAGDFIFSFEMQNPADFEEIQVIIRSNKLADRQTIDINFWLAVTLPAFDEPEFINHFKHEIRQALRQHLLPVNLDLGEIEIIHPAPDELETFAAVNIDTDLADCSYIIAESVKNQRALNIGLVDQLTTGEKDQTAYVQAISSGSPGMILAPSSPHTCILAAWPMFQNDYPALADAIIQQMLIFSGVALSPIQPGTPIPPRLTHEIAWSLRRHPLFYESSS